jgi:hypothetical protein
MKEKLKDLEINEQPHNNGTSGGLAYYFGQGGCKKEMQENKSNSSLHDFARMA